MGNYKKFGNDNTRLVMFNTDNLDNFESMQYDRFSNSMDKASALQILINNVEGDYSQLSKQLSEIAEEQYPSNEFFEDNREYKNGGGVGSSQTEFTYSVIIRPKSEQYYGVQFKQYAGSKALILANREKFSKDFDFDKSSEEFQKLLKNYSDKCSVDLDVYDSHKMIFPKNFTLNVTEQIDAEINEILESLYYVEVTNKDNTSLYIYNEFRNEITADINTAVDKIKSNLPIEDSYDITIRVIRMKDGKVVDTQKVLKKDKLPRIMVDWNNVKRVATIVEEEGKRFDIKYKDIIAFIREELDTPQVIKSRIKMLENLNIKEEAKDNIAKNIPIAIKLNYYLKYKMNYKDGNFDIVRGFKKGGGVGEQIAKMGTTVITKEYIDRFDMLSSAYNMSDINYYMFRGELKKPIEDVERDIAKAKKEIELVNKRLPFTTWELKLKKGQNKFEFLGDIYEIYSEKKPMESYGWRNRGWEKAYYGIRKITNNSEKDYFTQIPINEKKEELISMLNWKFITSIYKQEIAFPLPENDSFKGGGKIKRSKESIIADSRYNALPEGSRKSKKYATIELANGTKIRRRNANQTGDVEGGRYYSEKRPNHTDKSGKVVVSVRTKETKKVVKTSVSVLKPSDSIKFVGINFKKYNYTVGGL